MAPVVTRPIAVAAALAFASAASAQTSGLPKPHAGRIDVSAEWSGAPTAGGPGVRGRFSWYPSRQFTVGFELGYTVRPLKGNGATAILTFVDAGLTSTYAPVRLGPVMPYALASVGYRIVEDSDEGTNHERATYALGLGLGAWMRLSGRLGIFLEDRFEISHLSVYLGGQPHATSLGGNMACIGVVVLFDPEKDITR